MSRRTRADLVRVRARSLALPGPPTTPESQQVGALDPEWRRPGTSDGGQPWVPRPAPGGTAQAALRAAAVTHAPARARERRPRGRAPRVRVGVPWRLAAVAGAVAVLLGVGVAARAIALRPGTAVDLGVPAPAGSATAAPTADALVVVHVVGAVGAPGVVSLPAGSRVVDAVAAAGGATPSARLDALNLARTLVDGEQIVVPDSEGTAAAAAPTAAADGLVDLNTASEAELDALPGVGPVLAGRIVAARPFASVDQLDDVSGVGPAVLARLRDLVRV